MPGSFAPENNEARPEAVRVLARAQGEQANRKDR